MARPLPRLRTNLDFTPSPSAERPGLVIRDPCRYSDATLIVPPALVSCLQCFDGERTELDLREILVRLTGDIRVSELERHLLDSLSKAGFLEDEVYAELREARHRGFAAARQREAVHAGSAYPNEPEALRATLLRHLDGVPSSARGNLVGIAAPHVSPEGGWQSYSAAYRALRPEDGERTFVILGTSHYGEPERFGLTRKAFVTPFGGAITDTALVDELERKGGAAVRMEDYCHAVEHSIEFQVVFLQYLYGPAVRVVPILCGPYARSLAGGGLPEQDENVKRFLGALGEIASREGVRLCWVLGVDMAHMGRRYGDTQLARADRGEMLRVAERDRERIACISRADAAGFWELVRENHDDLKWCGSSPFYTLLKAVPEARGELLRYQQWNIDPQSVVSFGALAFAT